MKNKQVVNESFESIINYLYQFMQTYDLQICLVLLAGMVKFGLIDTIMQIVDIVSDIPDAISHSRAKSRFSGIVKKIQGDPELLQQARILQKKGVRTKEGSVAYKTIKEKLDKVLSSGEKKEINQLKDMLKRDGNLNKKTFGEQKSSSMKLTDIMKSIK